MIVYNVQRAWFPTKAEADAYRVNQSLPVDAIFKLVIDDRETLAAFLNALMGLTEFKDWVEQGPMQVPAEVVERNYVEVPDYVPLFLAKEAAKGRPIKWVKDPASI